MADFQWRPTSYDEIVLAQDLDPGPQTPAPAFRYHLTYSVPDSAGRVGRAAKERGEILDPCRQSCWVFGCALRRARMVLIC